MKNYINENINTTIKWNLYKGTTIIGLNIFDKEQKTNKSPVGYCGSIESTGSSLQIWTNGKYQFIKKEIAVKLLKELLKRLES